MRIRQIPIILILFFIILINYIITSSKDVIFRGSKSVTRNVPASFQRWFCEPQTPMRILTLNPGLLDIKKLPEDGKYICQLAPIEFPGLSVENQSEFNIL